MAKKYELRLGSNTDNPLDGGVRFDDETILNNSQSPHNGLLNLCLDNGRILGKMGHSERIGDNLYKNITGKFDMKIFEAGVSYFK